MNVLEHVQQKITYLDGALGTLLQKQGLQPGEYPERWNLSHPEQIIDIQQAYFDTGVNIVCTNTFGANSLKFEEEELTALIRAAVENARMARERSRGSQEKFIALDIGPTGRLLKPYGDFDFEEAVAVYGKTIAIGAACGVDLVYIETMNDSYDTKAALLAAKENCDLPVFVSNAYGEDGKLMTGASPAAMVALLEGMGADAIGINCSLGPVQMQGIVEEYLKYASVPVLVKPNAGLPRSVDGETIYDVNPAAFSDCMKTYLEMGVHIAGGCCGTSPDYLRAVIEKSSGLTPVPVTEKDYSLISSYTHAVEFGPSPILIGERINPTGKKKFKEALRSNDMDYILNMGLTQQERGVHVLDVNVGLPEIDEADMIRRVTYELQAILDLPLQIDTTDMTAMEAALRLYNGKAMVNSVNGKEEVMREVFPLVKKYGGLVVCLTLDENGIPETAEERVAIAEKIIRVAGEYGISRKDLIFDTLAMTISADNRSALVTLEALRRITEELGCHTSLGVSNVSFGLPNREMITAAFFQLALENGLSAAIMNPNAAEMMKAYYCFRALHGLDANCGDYIENIGKFVPAPAAASVPGPQSFTGTTADGKQFTGQIFWGEQGTAPAKPSQTGKEQKIPAKEPAGKQEKPLVTPLQKAVIKGLRAEAARLTEELLQQGGQPLEIVNGEIIPALDTVGQGFEKKTMFLPQLLMSAEAAQYAFEKIKAGMAGQPGGAASKGIFVIATVKGDVHDIGKNIVKLVLENYGFEVVDLGKDVAPEVIADAVAEKHAPLCGLSALMTTTVPAMEETIKLLREKTPWVKVAVGGAVLTQEYADAIGADFYGKDAMATVRYAVQVVEEQ